MLCSVTGEAERGRVQYWLELTLLFIVCAPLLIIAYDMKRHSGDQLSDQIKAGAERHKRLKALHEERQKEERQKEERASPPDDRQD